MSFTSISERTPLFYSPNTASHLGPGTYDFLPAGDKTAYLKQKL